MIEAKLTSLLRTVCPSVFPVNAPQGVKAPFVIYSRVSTTRLRDFDGPTGNAMPTFRVDVYALDFDLARSLASSIRKKLDGYSDDTLDDCQLVNEQDLSDLTNNVALTRINLEFKVSHKE
ncbi:Protein of unknown function [Sphingomonas gellani]|uniref:DUF3168 domain-containing protein n=1 Tax=Sphingomonas gellani TaxID=1166340 RepID=A0A1H7Y338_9SPHN|nr:DUF3168 domain-containing protein [Sphingomonas gellani]SEM40636.1 Protein of unknown function [Sphingomonas gellani]